MCVLIYISYHSFRSRFRFFYLNNPGRKQHKKCKGNKTSEKNLSVLKPSARKGFICKHTSASPLPALQAPASLFQASPTPAASPLQPHCSPSKPRHLITRTHTARSFPGQAERAKSTRKCVSCFSVSRIASFAGIARMLQTRQARAIM